MRQEAEVEENAEVLFGMDRISNEHIGRNMLDISSAFTFVTYLLRTISIGTPGFTIAIFIHSLPRSTDMTATLTANIKASQVK